MRTTVPTRYWHRLDDGRLQCDLCPRGCRLREGQHGLCFVRAAEGGQVVLAAYGRASGLCVDPIEKKPLGHFLPGSAVLSFGTAGCNLTCRHCQNWHISRSRELATVGQVAAPVEIARAALRLGCDSVAFTYNDPIVFMEYAVDVADACRELGIRAVAVTAGYVCDAPRRELFRHMDAANVDLKAFTDRFYARVCSARLQTVLDTLVHLATETDVWLELTTLLIPGHNDAPGEIDRMTRWVVRELGPHVPVHFSAFHPDHRMRDVPRTPAATLIRAREMAMANGVRYAYTGNILDPAGQTTHCHRCGAAVVERAGHRVTGWHLGPDACCVACGERMAGVFAGAPRLVEP